MPLRRLWEKIKFFNRKLDVMIKNDIRLFLRDRRALILALLTPFFIMAILINVYNFSDITENIRGIQLGVCEREQLDIDVNTTIFEITKYQGMCNGLLKKQVLTGELRAGIIIPENFRKNIEEGKGAVIEAYIDNSKPTTSIVSLDAMKAFVSDMNEKIGREFILNAWNNLNKLNENLRLLVKNLAYAKEASEELKMKLDETSLDLEEYDIESYNLVLDEILEYMDAIEKISLPSIEPPKTNVSLENINASKISGILNLSEHNITDNRTKMLIEELNDRLEEIESKNDQLNQELNESTYMINAIVQSTPIGLRENITYLKKELSDVQNKIEEIDSNITELKANLDNYLAQIVRLTDELNQTIIVIDEYTGREPESIIRAVTLDAEPVFKGKTQIYYRLPVLAATVLMFVTLLIASSTIVAERKAGTMARIFLSPISMFFYIFEKIGYLFVLSVLQLISIYITIMIFNIPLTLSLDLLVALIVSSILFVTLGIFVGTFSRSENTALLISLVMGLPMMFLTDLFSPPELMTEITKSVTNYLPLSLSVESIERIIIYNASIEPTILGRMLILALVLYLFSTFFIYRKPTL